MRMTPKSYASRTWRRCLLVSGNLPFATLTESEVYLTHAYKLQAVEWAMCLDAMFEIAAPA